jgi:hypothetical protein
MTNIDRGFRWGDLIIFFEFGLAKLGRFENYTSDDMVEVLADGQNDVSHVPASEVLVLKRRTDNAAITGSMHEVAAVVKEHHGDWVCIEEIGLYSNPHSNVKERARLSNRASLIKQGRLKAFQPRGCYDAWSVRERDSNGNAVYRVYVRYAGLDGVLAVAEELLG